MSGRQQLLWRNCITDFTGFYSEIDKYQAYIL